MPNNIAWGFTSLEDVFQRRVSELTNGPQMIRDAVIQSAQEYNRQANAIMGPLATRTTLAKQRYSLAGKGTLQPLDEWGNPQPRKPTGSYDVAYPIQGGGDAWGDNRVSRAKITVEMANDFTLQSLKADADWLIRHALAALFDNSSWTFSDPEVGDLTIMPLASGDSVEYVTRNGNSATDNHYYAQAASIADISNPFEALVTDLEEHPSNGTGVVFYLPTNLVASVKGLAEFIDRPDANITQGTSVATLNSDGASGLRFGDKVLGYLKSSRAWVVEWSRLPSNYFFGLPLNGEAPLRMREHAEAELQGLIPEFHSPDGNLQVNRVIRYAGFGAANRVGAICARIGNASYATPTELDAPLPV